MNDFARNLKNLREEKGLTLQELADVMNQKYNLTLTKGMISKWENDKIDAGAQYVMKLANFFGVTVDFMLGIIIKEEPKQEEVTLLAAHYEGENLLEGIEPDQLKEILDFIKFKKSQKLK